MKNGFWSKAGTILIALSVLLSFTSIPLAAAQSTQSPTFTIQSYQLFANTHIAVDLNGDGILDLAGPGANGAAVMLGNADGTFRAKVDYPAAGQAQDLAAGDFNSDGKQDLAVTINTPQISLSLLTGNGDGTFNTPVNFPNTTGSDSPVIVSTDVNNDSRLDLLIAHTFACFTAPCRVSDDLTIMLGNGNGTFQSRQIDVGTGMAEIAVGDFNRDGLKDLAMAGDSAWLYLLRGNGDGTFRAPHIITEPLIRIPQYQAVADYNGDGSQDLALALGVGDNGLMGILIGNGDGTFQPLVLYDVPPPKTSVAGGHIVAGDFNRDGKPDIALQVRGAFPALHILINTTNARHPEHLPHQRW